MHKTKAIIVDDSEDNAGFEVPVLELVILQVVLDAMASWTWQVMDTLKKRLSPITLYLSKKAEKNKFFQQQQYILFKILTPHSFYEWGICPTLR
jgi:hypothetical protein